MGSVAAVISKKDVPSPDPAKRMLHAAPHRGEKFEVAVVGSCVLGISYVESRPDSSLWSDERAGVAFTGKLDNVRELAASYPTHAPSNGSASTAEFLCSMFLAHGTAFVPAMRGHFAVLITDRETLWSVRDQIGFAPLHFRSDESGIYFASEAKQVVAGATIACEPDVELLEQMFFWNHERALSSPLKGVERVPKATVGTARGSVAFDRYWPPQGLLESARLSDEEISLSFDRLMTQAASRSLAGSDVISLSGGIDSPAVAAFATAPHLDRFGTRLNALSEVFPSYPSVDESEYIRAIAEHLNLDLHTYEPGPRRLQDLDRWAELFDGPVPTWNPNDELEYYEAAQRAGFHNIITGGLAESVMDQGHQTVGHLLWHGRWRALAIRLNERRRHGARIRRLAHDVASALMPRRLQIANMKRKDFFFGAPIPKWIDGDRLKQTWDRVCVSAPDRWRHAQLSDTGEVPSPASAAQEILQTSMGLTVRRPWADVDLWEFFLSLRAESKFPEHGHKVLVRKLLRSRLPARVLDRKDRTVFNDWATARVDYPTLRRWLIDPPHRLGGIDYNLLRIQLEQESLDFIGLMRAQDLAFVHAFLDRWR